MAGKFLIFVYEHLEGFGGMRDLAHVTESESDAISFVRGSLRESASEICADVFSTETERVISYVHDQRESVKAVWTDPDSWVELDELPHRKSRFL